MLNELVSLIKHLPELKKVEYKLNSQCYWMGGASILKESLGMTTNNTFNNDNSNASLYKKVFDIIRFSAVRDELKEILKSVDIAQDIFSKLPLKLQLKHIFNIPRCIDESTYMEDYKIGSNACERVMLNYLMISYAEMILPKLQKEEKMVFLSNLENNLHKGGFLGAKIYEEDHLILLNKWQLEHELADNNSPKPKKVMKI